jgi:hypothetical protein
MNAQTCPYERAGVSRRTVARTAAWAAPVVLTAVAAPSYAASGGVCVDRGSDPLSQGVGTTVAFLAFFDPTGKATGVQADVAITATDAQGNPLPSSRKAAETGKLGTTDYQPSWNYITLHDPKGMKQGDTLTLTISYNRVVRNATLTITDIDKLTGQWIDQVYASPSGYVAARGPNVVGTGASGDPFVASVEAEIHTSAGDVRLTWPGAVTQVKITYVAGDRKNSSGLGQHIGVGQFAYDSCA